MARASCGFRAFARGRCWRLRLARHCPARRWHNWRTGGAAASQGSRDQPVTFTADSVEYDRENALVIAQGHVEAWQGDHVLRADKVTFDRNTGIAAAKAMSCCWSRMVRCCSPIMPN